MRKLIVALIAGAAGALVVSSAAQALPTFQVSPTGGGPGVGSVTVTSASDTATFDIIFVQTAGAAITSVAVSVSWSAVVVGVAGAQGGSLFNTVFIPLGGTVGAGPASSYGGSSLFGAPAAGTYTIGTLKVKGAAVGSTTITPLFIGGDGASIGGTFFCSTAGPGPCAFASSTVNHIPEPATAALLGFGLLGLVAAGRRARRR